MQHRRRHHIVYSPQQLVFSQNITIICGVKIVHKSVYYAVSYFILRYFIDIPLRKAS